MTTAHPANATRALARIPSPSWRRDQLWIPAGLLVALLLVLAGWTMFVSPQRQEAASVTAQAATTTTEADTLAASVKGLAAKNQDLATYRAQLAAARQALPTTSALPDFLRSLQAAGAAAGVEVSGLSATPPTAVTATGAAADGTAPSALYEVTISVTAKGSYDGLAAFVAQLQQVQPRAVLITEASEQATDTSTGLTLTMKAFLAPGAATAVK